VGLERAVQAEGLVRADPVEGLPVGLGLAGQGGQVVDLEPVQVLVLQGSERPLADGVLARAAAPGADVDQFGPGGDERGERVALERAAASVRLSVTSLIQVISPVALSVICSSSATPPARRSASAIAIFTAAIASAPVQPGAMCQPYSTLDQ